MSAQVFPIPDWINSTFLQRILQNKYGDKTKDLEIAEFSVKSGSGSGESYGGDLFRIRIGAPDASYYSFILKTPHSDDYKRSIVTVYDFYGKEGTFYQKYSQPLHEILKSAGEYERLTPELIYCNEEDHVLILKNLSPEGYLPGVRGTRLCYATAEIVMRKMAKLHASSMVLNRNLKGQLEEMAFDMFCKDGPFLEHFIWFFDDLTEAIRSSEDKDYESILLKLKVIKEDYPNLAHRATTSKRGLNALNHGDLWYTNVLAKKTGSIVEDVQLIDFQLMGWASISTDLLCFFFRSLNEEDYQQGFDELLKIYHENLSRVLLKMNYPKIPSLDDILAELKDNSLHVLYAGLYAKLFSDVPTEGLHDFRVKLQDPRIFAEVTYILKWMEREGALDQDESANKLC